LSWFLSQLQIFYCEIHSTLVAEERAVKIAGSTEQWRIDGQMTCNFTKKRLAVGKIALIRGDTTDEM
jgi:hypothetical protein